MNPLTDFNFIGFISTNSKVILKGLVIPAILSILTSVINTIKLFYSNSLEKNRYHDLLRINYSSVEAVDNTIKQFKRISQIYSINILFFGLVLGCSYFPLFLDVFSKSAHFSEFFEKYILLADMSYISNLCYLLLILVIGPISFNSIVGLFCCKLIKSKRLLNENDNDFCKLRNSQTLAYFLFWFFVGLILGPYVLGIVMLYVFETNKIYLAHTIGWIFRWTSYDKFALVFIIVISLLVMFLSFNFLFDLLKKIGQFPKTVIDPIINHYQSNFPSLMVKLI